MEHARDQHQPAAEPAAPVTGGRAVSYASAGPAGIFALQRSAGNAAVSRLVVQRDLLPGALRNDEGTPEQIAKAISGKDPGDVKAINDFSRAEPSQKIQLLNVLLAQDYIGTFDQRAMTRIFNSYGDLEKLDADAVAVLKRCHDRDLSLHGLNRYDNFVIDLKTEVRQEALNNLGANVELIKKEAARLGVSTENPDAPPTAEQAAAMHEQQELAQQIADAKKLMAACSKIVVAHHGFLGGPDDKSTLGSPIMFDPVQEPAGPGIDPVTATSAATHEMPWKAVYTQYEGMSKAVASVLNANPALYALASLTEAAPDEKPTDGKDPHLNFGQTRLTGFDTLAADAARKKMHDALTEVYNNSRLTMGKVMSGQLPSLQLDSVIRRFQTGDHGARWSAPYAKYATSEAVTEDSSSFDKTMGEIGLALLLASVVIGTAGAATPMVGAILAAANVGTAVAGAAVSTMNAEDLNRASQSAVNDQNAVVSPEKAGKAELDALMYQFAAIVAVAGEGAGLLLSGSADAMAVANLGAASKMSQADRASSIISALETMEPGQVALRTGIPPEEMLGMIAPHAAESPAAASAVDKLRQFVNKFSGPLIGPTAGATNTIEAMLRAAKMTFREYWSKVYGLGLRQIGDVSLHAGFGDAELEYIRLIEESPAREAGIYRNSRTGEHSVVQGSGDFNQGSVPHMNGLPEAGGDTWILVEHYHPERNAVVQFPSGNVVGGQANGDFAVLLYDHGETNMAAVMQGQPSTVIKQRVSARIRFRDSATGAYHFTTYGYDPGRGAIGAFFVEAETETGAIVDYSFNDISGIGGARADYERHMSGVTKGSPVVKATP